MTGLVRSLLALAVVLVCALMAASVVLAAEFGANDDGAKYAEDGGESFYATMAADGLHQTVLSVRWQPSAPTTILDQERLDRILPVAQRHGVRVVFAAYPYPPREIQSGLATPQAFADWLTLVATRYPQVRQFVVGNEPNQPAFWRPQFGAGGRNVSAAGFGAFLATAYDALKGHDPGLTVIGVGLSPRGNDKPRAASNISTSPVRFLAALGRWYRSSGRERPLMDGFSFHPYPNKATDTLEKGYVWPGAGFVNLDRVKQALWDAFHGTPQPTTLEGLKLYLDEVGWQVDTSFHPGYVDAENVPVTDEVTQAGVYVKLVRRAQCDLDVAEVNVFGLYDDRDRRGFQAALHRVDGSARPAAEAVRAELQRPGSCVAAAPWAPVMNVVGAVRPGVTVSRGQIVVTAAAAEGAVARACSYPRRVTPAVAAGLPEQAGGAAALCTRATVLPNRPAVLVLGLGARRAVTVGVRVTAEANAGRTSSWGIRPR